MRGEAHGDPKSDVTQQEHYDLAVDFLKSAAKKLAIATGALVDARQHLNSLDYPSDPDALTVEDVLEAAVQIEPGALCDNENPDVLSVATEMNIGCCPPCTTECAQAFLKVMIIAGARQLRAEREGR